MTWPVGRWEGSAAEFHGRPVPEPAGRAVWVFECVRPALVLGSTQPDSDVDHDAARVRGIDVVRRRSGGGAVLVVPGSCLWIDVVLPRGDRLWDDDVGRAFLWLGEVWAATLTGLAQPAEVHRGGLLRSEWSDRVCFAGLGPGEVVAGGRKLVGISQRRTRTAARFQCAALFDWDPAALLALLTLDDDERSRGALELATTAAPVDLEPHALESAFIAALP